MSTVAKILILGLASLTGVYAGRKICDKAAQDLIKINERKLREQERRT